MRRPKPLLPILALFAVIGVVLPTPALALTNPERHYEMVSPVYKGGYGAKAIEAVAPGGERVLFYSAGAFAGAPSGPVGGFDYIAQRTPGGWSTSPVMAPAELMPYTVARDVSPSLGTVLELGKPGTNQEGSFQGGTVEQFMLHSTALPDVAANWEIPGMALKTFPEEVIALGYFGASPDFCHIFVTPTPLAGNNFLLPEEAGASQKQLYELDRGCNGEPVSLRRVGSNNKNKSISPSCPVETGAGEVSGADQSRYNAIAGDGSEVFFNACIGGVSSHIEVFVRVGGETTLEVSKPLGEACSEVPCVGAATRANSYFVGASEDGSSVFFTTTARLDPASDMDNGNDLYMARVTCPDGGSGCEAGERRVTSLVQVSHDLSGDEADVQGVVRLSPDGSRAYFVARGELLSAGQRAALESEGRGVPRSGADNLYVYDSQTEGLIFIADLCSGRESSGVVEDINCPSKTGSDSSLWSEKESSESQTAGANGNFLVFASYAQLSAGDTDATRDVYRYDAETDALQRVSIGENGADANGNDNFSDASIAPGHWTDVSLRFQFELDNRAVSEDGSRIVFTSEAPLSPVAGNHLANAYEWHEDAESAGGRVSLISTGQSEEAVEHVTISPQGSDIFFVTSQGLVSQDTDGSQDIYDARLGEGFPAPLAERRPCEGDACQGPLSPAVSPLAPSSIVAAGGPNAGTPKAAPLPGKPKASKARCVKGKQLQRGRCVTRKRAQTKKKVKKPSRRSSR